MESKNHIIGESCYIVRKGGLRFGEDVLVGTCSKIVTTSHNYDRANIPIRQQALSSERIFIDDDIWLGLDVTILPGSKLGKGCIVGEKSIKNSKTNTAS